MAYNITSTTQCTPCIDSQTDATNAGDAYIDIATIIKTYQDVRYVAIAWSTISPIVTGNYSQLGIMQGSKYSIPEGILTALLEWAKGQKKQNVAKCHMIKLFDIPGVGPQNGLKLYSLLSGVQPIDNEFAAVIKTMYEIDKHGNTCHNIYELKNIISSIDIVCNMNDQGATERIFKYVSDLLHLKSIKRGVTEYVAKNNDIVVERHFKNLPGCQIITGGGGTGKTTTIIEAVDHFASHDNSVMILTPTNKAKAVLLARLPEEFNHIVFTVDRYAFMEAYQPDVIIVDEASMLTNYHFSIIHNSPAKHYTYLVGDVQQLPPVGTGRLFADLIEGKYHPTSRLTKNYRTDAPDILKLAESVIRGRSVKIAPSENVEVLFEPDYDAMVKDTNSHIITHTRAVVSHVNKIMMNLAKMMGRPAKYKYTANDSAEWYRNRMVIKRGKVYHDADTMEPLDRGEGWSAHHLEEGFCTTIHTAQGGGWDTVYLILDLPEYESRGFMERALMYTAVTRAKKKLVIITERDYIGLRDYRRNTLLNGGLV